MKLLGLDMKIHDCIITLIVEDSDNKHVTLHSNLCCVTEIVYKVTLVIRVILEHFIFSLLCFYIVYAISCHI